MYGCTLHHNHTGYHGANGGYQQPGWHHGTYLFHYLHLRNGNGCGYLFLERRRHTGYGSELFQCTGCLYSNGNGIEWLYGYCKHHDITGYNGTECRYQ